MNLALSHLSFILIFLIPVNWWATVRLWRLSQSEPDLDVLRERAIASLALSVILTLLAIVYLNADFGTPLFPFDVGRLLSRIGTVLIATPALYWLWLSQRD